MAIRNDNEEHHLDLDFALRSVVMLQAKIPEDGFTAEGLGTERAGSGVVIREDGLVLTIGYLITEAQDVELTTFDGRTVPAHPIAYDQETGFGLVQAMGDLNLPAMPLGQSADAEPGDRVILAAGGRDNFVRSTLMAKQEFAGYWEYLLDEALFIAPAHKFWGGAALMDQAGKLIGIGSLLVQQETRKGAVEDLNMVVPIDLLPPILDELLAHGQTLKPPRPWLGVFSAENNGQILVASVAGRGPAAAAGLQQGDIVRAIGDTEVEDLTELYRKLWSCGPAGTEIPLEIIRDGRSRWLRIKSANRASMLRKPHFH